MDKTDQTINVWSPDPVAYKGHKFPLIRFAHGAGGGGSIAPIAYGELLKGIAEFGYVVVMPEACDYGCSDGASLPHDPEGFKNFYQLQLKAIEWAQNKSAHGEEGWEILNVDIGAGVAGHSMGGQATVYSSGAAGVSHNIKAAVMHHAYTHSYPAPLVPFLAFTGTGDTTASTTMTSGFFNAAGASPVKGLVNKIGAVHQEPTALDYNPNLAPLTAAWFKIFLDKTPQANGIDFHDLIFGSGTGSLCHGFDGAMQQCELHDASGEESVLIV